MRRALAGTVLVSVLTVATPHLSLAADKDWDGSASQDFNTAANWNIGGAATTVPTGVDNAFIQLEAANVTLSAFSKSRI